MSKKLIRLLLITLAGFHFIHAQDVALQLHVINQEALQTLYISDMDLQQIGTAEELFTLQIDKHSNTAINDCRLEFFITKDNKILAQARSNIFNIPAPPSVYQTNNVQLFSNQFYFDIADQSTHVRIIESELGNDLNQLQEDVLTTGKAPVGVYKLKSVLYYSGNNSEITSDEIEFLRASNPSYVQLISPGRPAGYSSPDMVYTEFPMFQWNGNGDSYRVLVFEKKPFLQSFDEVLNTLPNWDSGPINEFSAIYPQGSGAIPLEFGKTYYWLIQMLVNTSGGTEEINSEIWEFTVTDPSSDVNSQQIIARDELLAFLRDFLGMRVTDLEEALSDYRLKSIRVNGEQIQVDELYRLLNQLRGKDIQITDIVMPGGSY